MSTVNWIVRTLFLAVTISACSGYGAIVVTPSPTAAPPGPCEPTKAQSLGGSRTAVIGGNLAYLGPTQWRLDTDEKAGWLWRTNDRTQRLRLVAQRLDANRASIEFDLGPAQQLPVEEGAPAPATFPPEWGSGLGYGGYAGLPAPKLPEVGCWRLSIKGGTPTDAVVIRVVPKS